MPGNPSQSEAGESSTKANITELKLAANQVTLEQLDVSRTTHPVPARLLERKDGEPQPHFSSKVAYHHTHGYSVSDPDAFWGEQAREVLDWDKPFTRVLEGSFSTGNIKWFSDGELNASYNCIDRHVKKNPNKVAIIYEADEPGSGYKVTYGELKDMVCRLANVMLGYGLKKERVRDVGCRLLITADEGKRGGKCVSLKAIADEALESCPTVERVLVLRRTGNPNVKFNPGKDAWWHEELVSNSIETADFKKKQGTECPPVVLNAEHPLFILYTSGSTGAPKGVVHSTGGYLVGATVSAKYTFDCHEGDVFGCTADIGWITGHTYVIYGPLALGLTTVVFESTPTYPSASRYWQMVADHKMTQFYTSPTAIRALRRLGDHWVHGHDLSSLRVIGTVGEPIDPEAWHWYNSNVGKGRCAVVDTYWQTETGSIVITPLPCAIPTKPGAATVPFFGVDPVIVDPQSGKELVGNDVTGVLAFRHPWPSVARTIFKDHKRFCDTYLNVYPGMYFTGDSAHRDQDGYIWIRGRVDDVINVSGHRMSTSEIESALTLHPSVAETAVVGMPDQVTGQSICAFVTLKPGFNPENLTQLLIQTVRERIGPFARIKRIIFTDELPKTRSGKIIRRILRKIMLGEADQLGDLSTVSDPSVVAHLIQKAKI